MYELENFKVDKPNSSELSSDERLQNLSNNAYLLAYYHEGDIEDRDLWWLPKYILDYPDDYVGEIRCIDCSDDSIVILPEYILCIIGDNTYRVEGTFTELKGIMLSTLMLE